MMNTSQNVKMVLLVLTLVIATILKAQTFPQTSPLPATIVAEGEPETFSLKIIGPLLPGQQIQATLPSNAEYHSLVSTTLATVDASDKQKPIFTVTDSLAIGHELNILYKVRTSCHPNLGAYVLYKVIGYTIEKSYPFPTVLYSVIDIDPNITPANITVGAHQSEILKVCIKNSIPQNQEFAGYSTNAIILITHSTHIDIDIPSSFGTLIQGPIMAGTRTHKLIINSSAIQNYAKNIPGTGCVGDGDGRFENEEIIEVPIKATLNTCYAGNLTLKFVGAYGGQTEAQTDFCIPTTNTVTAGVNPKLGDPSLRGRYRELPYLGIKNNTGTVTYSLTNTSETHDALDIDIRMGFFEMNHNQRPVSFIDLVYQPFELVVESGNITLPWYAGVPNKIDSCARIKLTNFDNNGGGDPDGPGGLSDLDGDGFYDDLARGDSIVVKSTLTFDMETWLQNDCGDMLPRMNTSYVSFKNECYNKRFYFLDNMGRSMRWWEFKKRFEAHIINTPSQNNNVFDGDDFDLAVKIPYVQTFKQTHLPNLKWRFTLKLPNGIEPEPDASNPNGYKNGMSEAGFFPFNFISWDPTTREAVYEFNYDIVNKGGGPHFPLTTICQGVGSLETIEVQLQMLSGAEDGYPEDLNDTLRNPVLIPFSQSDPLMVGCPPPNCEGIALDTFYMERLNLGFTNAQETETIDPNDPNFRVRNLKYALTGDKVKLHSEAHVGSAAPYQKAYFKFQHFGASIFKDTLNGGFSKAIIKYFANGNSAGETFIDLSKNYYSTCDTLINEDSTALFTHYYDINNFLADHGKTLAPGDRLEFDLILKLPETPLFMGNTRGTEFEFPLDGILANYPVYLNTNPTKEFICNSLSETFSTIKSAYEMTCGPSSFGRCGDRYGLGITQEDSDFIGDRTTPVRFNLTTCLPARYQKEPFPGEYRSLARPRQIALLLPKIVKYKPGTSLFFHQAISDPIITDYDNYYRQYVWKIPTSIPANPIKTYQYYITHSREYLVAGFTEVCRSNPVYESAKTVPDLTLFEVDRNITYGDTLGRLVSLSEFSNIEDFPDFVLNNRPNRGKRAVFYIPEQEATTETDTASWYLDITGYALYNAWMSIVAPNNNIVPQLFDAITGDTIPLEHYGLAEEKKYWCKLGDLNYITKQLYVKTEDFTVCGVDKLVVTVGENCAGYPIDPETGYDDGESNTYICSPPINNSTRELFLNALEPAVSIQSTIADDGNGGEKQYDFCNVYTENIKVINGGSGSVKDLTINIKCPIGVTPDNGSPTIFGTIMIGSTSYNIPYSAISHNTGSLLYKIHISEIIGTPLYHELFYGTFNPDNPHEFTISLPINFTCDFVAGQRFKIWMTGNKTCGEPIGLVVGSNPIYTNRVSISEILDTKYAVTTPLNTINVLEACNENKKITVNIYNEKETTDSQREGVSVRLSKAFNIINNSTQNIQNASDLVTQTPQNNVVGEERVIRWAMPDGIAQGEVIRFSFYVEVEAESLIECGNHTINISTYQSVDLICTDPPKDCSNIELISGSSDMTMTVTKSNMQIVQVGSTEAHYSSETQTENISVSFRVRNTSDIDIPDSSAVVKVYKDRSNSGTFDANDAPALASYTIPTSILAHGITTVRTIEVPVSPLDVCRLFLVVESGCACNYDDIRIQAPTNLDSLLTDPRICQGDTFMIGNSTANMYSTYRWTGINESSTEYLSSTTVANPEFIYPQLPTLSDSVTLSYRLTVERPNGGCTSYDDIEITALPKASITINDVSDDNIIGEAEYNSQWNLPITVSGGSNTANASISVAFNGETYTTTTDEYGDWTLDIPNSDLPNVPAGTVNTNYNIVATIQNSSGCNTNIVKNISINRDNTLPIELLNFNAYVASKHSQTVILKWCTATEINNEYFDVERSTDALQFENIGTEMSQDGNSNTKQCYQYKDRDANYGLNYYRLKQVDTDGNFTYSPVRAVKVHQDWSMVSVYPNPSSGDIFIEGFFGKLESIQLYNVLSIPCTSKVNLQKVEGRGYYMNIETLSQGTYILQIEEQTYKIIKK